MKVQDEIKKLLKRHLKQDIVLEIPPKGMGDYSLPCFQLAKKLRRNPSEIAQELSGKIRAGFIERTEARGAYLNFFIRKEFFVREVLMGILGRKENYGSSKGKDKVVVEFPSPNTNKPLHLGHVRNMLIGESVSRILEFSGNKVYRANLNNDRGIHICKSMLAYKKFGKNRKPDKKTDHFVGDFYVLFSKKAKLNKKLEAEAQELLRKWEQNDKETINLWRKLNGWALKGFDETYRKFGLRFDKVYNESSHYREGRDIVMDGLKKGVFYRKKDNAVAVDLSKFGLDEKILLRPDGTSIYITQDINLARLKYRDFKYDKSIYVVGSEQNYHFKALFKILELLKVPYSRGNYHLSYGMVYLPHGRMKSREGTVVDADDLIDKMLGMARKEVNKRYRKLPKKELEKRSRLIGMAALKFFILKTDAGKDMNFNPEESISFEGETGPYCQYAHARISSILRKYKKRPSSRNLMLEKEDIEMARFLSQFPAAVENAARNYKPHIIARYILELAQKFNNYYERIPVLKAEKSLMESRILLITAVRQVLKNGLLLLGIESPSEM